MNQLDNFAVTEDLFELIPMEDEGVFSLRLTEGPYKDMQYKYNKCSLDEDGENAILHFDYDILEDIKEDYDTKDFENYIGNILIHLIQKYVAENKAVYSGGEGEIQDEILDEIQDGTKEDKV